MGLIADIILIAAALGATFYCYVLSRRLAKFNDLERGVGGAVAVLSVQVDDMTKTLKQAETAAKDSTTSLRSLTERAEGVAKRLELLVAAMHDLPDQSPQPTAGRAPEQPDPSGPADTVAMEADPKVQPENQPKDQEVLFLRHRVPTEEAVI